MEERISIIVVDDEPISADELGELLRAEEEAPEVRVAYHAAAALSMVAQRPCDLLISDIQMPGMSGLKLAETLRQTQRELSILFLTGHDDFTYAYEAFRHNAVRYLLKTEGDDVILGAVREVMGQIKARRRMVARIHEAEQRYAQMLPVYRQQWLMQTLLGGEPAMEGDTGLCGGQLFTVLARCDETHGAMPARQKLIALTAVREMMEDALSSTLAWSEAFALETELAWVFSAKEEGLSNTLFQLTRKARRHVEEQLHLSLFFVVAEEATGIDGLSGQYARLRSILSYEIVRGEGGVAMGHAPAHNAPMNERQAQALHDLRRQLEVCARDVRDGRLERLQKDAGPVLHYVKENPPAHDLVASEFLFSMYGMLYAYVNQNRLGGKIAPLAEMAQPGGIPYLEALMETLGSESEVRRNSAMQSIAHYTAEYIRAHLSEDIGISALADATGYSAGYLSRVFKQQEGISIHEYVTMTRLNLARELLCNTNLRIYEIASACGYENTTYFIKVFKTKMGMTPQEYKQEVAARGR